LSPRANQSTTITLLTPAGVSSQTLRRWAIEARRRLRLQGAIAIVIVPPSVSQRLNTTYRRKPKPTNVLSFDYAHDTSARTEGGEILLCPTVIRREAQQLGETYRGRLKMLLQHGLIHLLGLDHQTDAAQRKWERIEQRLA
jgi:probable rRNA maturation factor